jgi:hypothetical protein
VGVGIFAVLVLVAVAALVVLGGGDDGDDNASPDATGDTQPDTTDDTQPDDTQPDDTTTTSVDLAAGCDRSSQVCITSIRFDGDDLVAAFETDVPLTLPPDPAGSNHAHFYLSPTMATGPTSGTQAGDAQGEWRIWASPGEFSNANHGPSDSAAFTRADIGSNTQLCSTVANQNHESDPSTEHCVDLPQ